NSFLTLTAGTGVMASIANGSRPWAGELRVQRNGALTASSPGTALTYGLANAQQRGTIFIEPGETVYEGMIVALQRRAGDGKVHGGRPERPAGQRSRASRQLLLTGASTVGPDCPFLSGPTALRRAGRG